MEDHVACMVAYDGIRVSYSIIKQAVTFDDSVGGWFLLLRGDLVEGGEHGGIECS